MAEDSNKTENANSVIKNHMIWSMGAAFIPVPIADFFAVSAIQLDMIRQLSKLYDVDFKETEGKAVITSLTGSGLARLGGRAIKFIPGVGSVLGGVTLAVLSGGTTYALGEVFKKHFDTGGTFLDFDPSRLKAYYDEKFEKGKVMAKEMKAKQDKVNKMHEEAEIIEKVKKQEADVTSPPSDNSTRSKPVRSSVDQLKGLADLLHDGVITQEEFEIMKKKVIEADIK